MSKPILLLSGVPGSGKSCYGRWLAKNKAYLHLDLEHGDLEKYGLQRVWDEFWSSRSDGLISALLETAAPVCLDWGFPPRCLPIVRRLADVDVELWWFEADPHLAKKYFLERATVSEAAFDEQMANIEASRRAIMELFGQHVIRVFREDGMRVPCEEIYAQMFK
ncbi:MAG TPA: hypothetical protein VFQ43_18775 [Nitrososphaera sp.]|nr:hypothetical protein [Nitrososphaera sp.]